MSIDRVLEELRGLPGVLELAPEEGSEHPEVSWGDHFFYYAPDGEVPTNRQPHTTVVTKDYPDDDVSQLDDPDRARLNVNVGSDVFADVLGAPPGQLDLTDIDHTDEDVFVPHPLYGSFGWVSVVNPGQRTLDRARELVRHAHDADRQRLERREAAGSA
jgi:hypothetical protein